MTSEDDDKPLTRKDKLDFNSLSIEDLTSYISELEAEIEKTKSVIKMKQAAQNAASGFFKA